MPRSHLHLYGASERLYSSLRARRFVTAEQVERLLEERHSKEEWIRLLLGHAKVLGAWK
jgi:hypothetical protein